MKAAIIQGPLYSVEVKLTTTHRLPKRKAHQYSAAPSDLQMSTVHKDPEDLVKNFATSAKENLNKCSTNCN